MSSNGTSEVDVTDLEEPSVTSADPNERKLARRLRIQRRQEALKKKEVTEEEDEQDEGKTLTEKQMVASAQLLEKLITEGNEVITNVKVANDGREIQRRREEREIRDKLLKRLEEDAEECTKKYEEINSKWMGMLSSKDPLDIHAELQEQNAKCLEILSMKNAVIAELKEELENADLKFEEDQKKQREDINLLIERIDSQVSAISKAYGRELVLIENAVESERKLLLEMVSKKWNNLFKKRLDNELNGYEQRKELMREYELEMEKVMIEHQEEFRAQKIKLETECQELQQEVQRTKAVCLMNVEKLNYNYAVLKRREDENAIIKNQQKRRINKLQDYVNDLKKKSRELEENARSEVRKLTEQVMRAHKGIIELLEKSQHFSAINEKRYLEIWDMNTKNANELLDQILATDKTLWEEVLSLEWEPLEKTPMRREDLLSYRKTVEMIEERKRKTEERVKICEPYKPATLLKDINNERKLLNHVIRQIANRSGFLIEDQLHKLLQPYGNGDNVIVVKLDNIFQALDITSEEEVNLLLNFFLPYTYCPTCRKEEESPQTSSNEVSSLSCACYKDKDTPEEREGSDDPIIAEVIRAEETDGSSTSSQNKSSIGEGECEENRCFQPKSRDPAQESDESRQREVVCDKGHLLEIEKTQVMKALKEFISKYHEIKKEQIPSTLKDKLSEDNLTISRNLSNEDVINYWQSYRDVFPSKREHLWDGLLVGLQKYYGILKKRHELSNETEFLRRQNAELRRLLDTYSMKPEKNVTSLKVKSACGRL